MRPASGHGHRLASGLGRSGIAATGVFAILVVLVVLAVGAYAILGPAPAQTSAGESQTSSRTSSTAAGTTGSSSSRSASVLSTSTGPFPFSLYLYHTSEVLVSPGGFTDIVTMALNHSVPLGTEAVALSSTSPAGISVTFSPSGTAQLPANGSAYVSLEITASANITLGNATVNVRGVSGPYSQSANFTLTVVRYLVVMMHSTVMSQSMFAPNVLNVTVGSTVYWENLDGNATACGAAGSAHTGYHNVVFTTIPNASSPTIQQFQVYSYTFAAPGSYYYYSSLDVDSSMSGTINVMAADGAGVADSPAIPAFSYFKGGTPATVPLLPPAAGDLVSTPGDPVARPQPFSATPSGPGPATVFGMAALGALALALTASAAREKSASFGAVLASTPGPTRHAGGRGTDETRPLAQSERTPVPLRPGA